MKQRHQLVRLLKRGPRKHDYGTELWMLKRVAEVIRKHFGVHCDPSGVWHVLRGMNRSCQKTERRAREGDDKTIERWRENDWPLMKKRAKPRT